MGGTYRARGFTEAEAGFADSGEDMFDVPIVVVYG